MHSLPCEQTSANQAFALSVSNIRGILRVSLFDKERSEAWCDAPYFCSLIERTEEGFSDSRTISDLSVEKKGVEIVARGRIGRLRLILTWNVPDGQPWIEETIELVNCGESVEAIQTLEFGCLRQVADAIGKIPAELDAERIVAVPFRKRPSDPEGYYNDYALADFLAQPGREARNDDRLGFGFLPSRHWCSEAWFWKRGASGLALMKFNQERMEFSTLSTVVKPDGLWMRFGGACLNDQEGNPALTLNPGESVTLGLTRYAAVAGEYNAAAYAYRAFLDARGCRFPEGFNPPVHWNELYDNPDWWVCAPRMPAQGTQLATRKLTYTRQAMEAEAEKARAYHCESLYLDPGWDTNFGSFIWDEERLGSAKEFVAAMRERYGLSVSVHAPLATWMSCKGWQCFTHDTLRAWPEEAGRMPENGVRPDGHDILLCLGSRQYLDEAEKRLLKICEAGAVYIMFDGNWWNGGCWNPNHGHPVPYTREDHMRANLELAQRIHARYPRVLIEMHDMLMGGVHSRMTPVYYKYGLPGSYDSNWGFELMWNPIEDLRSGRGQALYYYNLGCNVPVYLHIDLRDDNEHCAVFWWFASTCRHLGIGGTHSQPHIAAAQRSAMETYRRLEAFYKRGEFYGISEEIHLHVLPGENRIVVNLFNLSDTVKQIEGTIPASELGISQDLYYQRSGPQAWFSAEGALQVGCKLPPWGHRMVEFSPVVRCTRPES